MPRRNTKIAMERIHTLFQQAQTTYPRNPQLAQRHIDLARKIAQRTRPHLPPPHPRPICRKCNTYLVPGSTSRTRIRQRREPHVATTCLKCGKIQRHPLKEKQP